jgi:hypothetical protein
MEDNSMSPVIISPFDELSIMGEGDFMGVGLLCIKDIGSRKLCGILDENESR